MYHASTHHFFTLMTRPVHRPAHTQADSIVGFMHKNGENRSRSFKGAFVRGSVATASQEASEITGVQ